MILYVEGGRQDRLESLNQNNEVFEQVSILKVDVN